MSDPYVGDIRMFAGTFAPQGWMLCDGSLLSIAEYEVLFSLIGTTYGGDGQSTFQLPDLRGRIPMHRGTGQGLPNYLLGQTGGAETVTLTTVHLPQHTHTASASNALGHIAEPGGAFPAADRDFSAYYDATQQSPTLSTMASSSTTTAGSSQPHENMPPYLCVTFIISLFGVYPPLP